MGQCLSSRSRYDHESKKTGLEIAIEKVGEHLSDVLPIDISELPRWVLPCLQDHTVYRKSDTLLRCPFTITCKDGNLVIASGAEGELKLPGRNVIKLGLRTIGSPERTEDGECIWNFYPPVMVSATFQRKDKNGITRKEVVQTAMQVCTEKSDDDAALRAHTGVTESQSSTLSCSPATTTSTPSITPYETTNSTIGIAQLSPARHMPR